MRHVASFGQREYPLLTHRAIMHPWKGANPHGWGGGDQCEDEARDEANKEA